MGLKIGERSVSNLYDRIKKLLVSYEWSDCSFSVSGKKFKAHKLILAISSPVFEAMFYGPLSTNDDILISDVEPDIFQLLLNYIYTDNVEITEIEQAYELLYASKKYLIEHLSEICITYVAENMSVENVITILNYPEFMNVPELMSLALKLFCQHAPYLFQEHISDITLSCMKTVLSSNDMNIKEYNLIKHVFQWATQYSEELSITNLVDTGLIRLLRFNLLTNEELNNLAADSNFIDLFNEIQLNKSMFENDLELGTNIPNLGVRRPLKIQWQLCQRRPVKSVAPIVIDSNNYVIKCRVRPNKAVFITSLCVPTRMSPVLNLHSNITNSYSEEVVITIKCDSNNKRMNQTPFSSTVKYDSYINIDLCEPCLMLRNMWYTVTFTWPHCLSTTCWYVVEWRDNFYSDNKISFRFEDIHSSGTFLGGLKYCI